MEIINKHITCPFCFDRFAPEQVKFRCTNARCKREPDEVYARQRGILPASMGHVFTAAKQGWLKTRLSRIQTSASCDDCSQQSSERICPHCHFKLSHDAGLITDHVIAIIGGRGTGKGHYVATLIHRLENEIGSQFGFSLRMLGDETRRRFDEDYRDPLFRKKTLLQPTRSGGVEIQTKSPMVFRLTFKKGRWKRAINLSFF